MGLIGSMDCSLLTPAFELTLKKNVLLLCIPKLYFLGQFLKFNQWYTQSLSQHCLNRWHDLPSFAVRSWTICVIKHSIPTLTTLDQGSPCYQDISPGSYLLFCF